MSYVPGSIPYTRIPPETKQDGRDAVLFRLSLYKISQNAVSTEDRGAAFCAQTLRRIDADIVPVSVNSHSLQEQISQPPVSIIPRTTYHPHHIRLTIITIENTDFGQTENIFCILIDTKYHPKDRSYGWHQIVYVLYSSMTSNIILAPSLKLLWNIRHSVMV